jgi:lambda repressor-like predicted transcriptional regulator
MSPGVIRVGVEAVAICGPGLPDWLSSRPVLAGAEAYRAAPIVLQPPPQLSAAERRRAIPSVKLALGVATAAVARSGLDPASLPAVFAASGADGETITAILSALATPSREVSPTRFHNSVHNAPSGYWGIAVQSREAVTSVSCYDASFAAGLLEAAAQAVTGERPTLLVAYDLPYPDPLDSARRIEASFAVALVLSPATSDRVLAVLHLRVAACDDATGCSDPGLEALRRGNPAARALPLLAVLAGGPGSSIRLALSHGTLEVEVEPC